MCVLTGETGAGKSILLDALGFALGDRASAKLLRPGEQMGSVTARFDVQNHPEVLAILRDRHLVTEEKEIIIRRTIDHVGKSKAYINDQPVTALWLQELGSQLIEVHGQHDQRGLLDSRTNRQVLDEFGQLSSLLKKTADAYHAYRTLTSERDTLVELHEKTQQEQDYLRYVYQELDSLDLTADEAMLAEQRKRLMHDAKIKQAISNAFEILTGSTPLERCMVSAQNELDKFTTIEPALQRVIETLERGVIEINDAQEQLERLLHARPAEEASLEKIEQTLFALRGASRKYHVPVENLASFREEIKQKLEQLQHYDTTLEQMDQALLEAKKFYLSAATSLSTQRQTVSKKLEQNIMTELHALKMESTVFKVQSTLLPEAEWTASGIDRITFMASTNPGLPLAVLSKIASGGELSRCMLAIKVALSGIRSIPTLIFDEIDTGIGGATADAVGKRLQMLGEHVQILVVTHQPQVASKGNLHLKIIKHQDKLSTVTRVEVLTNEKRLEEIARMLAGQDVTTEARAAAGKLLLHTA